MAKEKAVVHGAGLTCTVGSIPSATGFVVTNGARKCNCGGSLVGVSTDAAVANVGTFGVCSVLSGPCAPTVVGPWLSTATKVMCENLPVIKNGSTLVCPVGGVISVTNPGQAKVDIE